MITEWWSGLDLFMKILWSLTLTASLIFVIQSILTFVGIGGDVDGLDGVDGIDGADAVDPGMNLYTFRNFVNFILGFGWTAIVCYEKITSLPLLVFVSIIVGLALVAAVMYLFKWLYGMQQSGNINVSKEATGCEGTVYLTIPAARTGEGQVQISINGSIREYSAVTDGAEIRTGTAIKVTAVVNSTTLLVKQVD